MNHKSILALAVATLVGPAASFSQKPADRPLSEADLLKQIESLTPPSARPAPARGDSLPARSETPPARSDTPPARTDSLPVKNDAPSPSLFDTGLGDPLKLGNGGSGADKPASEKSGSGADKTGDKTSKGPTEITALEASFDQKANVAIFIGEVVVKDPEFNVICDKLTAHMLHEDKGKPAPGTAAATTPRPVTPTPKGGDLAAKPKGGGLEKALAEMTSDRRVIITQDKPEADGTITHSIGKSDRATYNALTGDVVLYGTPDVIQGTNHCQATDAATVMTLTRDGHMKAVGPHRTTIVDTTRQQPSTPQPQQTQPTQPLPPQ